ncbi:MAG: hypothetical protein FJX04_03350 [Alphaproteobacteria bacterium]|nr:hypothetical protein [Alphaproteobacteria bacterium]
MNEFRWHKAIADRDAAELIAKDQLDILFELGSSTDMNKNRSDGVESGTRNSELAWLSAFGGA